VFVCRRAFVAAPPQRRGGKKEAGGFADVVWEAGKGFRVEQNAKGEAKKAKKTPGKKG
jgi:hypothetical protein